MQSGRIVDQPVAQDVEEVDADAIHGREHECLGEVDADVDPPDARPELVVGLVVRAEQHDSEPLDQRLLEPLDLSGAARDGRARARMGLDGGVEVVDDRDEATAGRGDEARGAQPTTLP